MKVTSKFLKNIGIGVALASFSAIQVANAQVVVEAPVSSAPVGEVKTAVDALTTSADLRLFVTDSAALKGISTDLGLGFLKTGKLDAAQITRLTGILTSSNPQAAQLRNAIGYLSTHMKGQDAKAYFASIQGIRLDQMVGSTSAVKTFTAIGGVGQLAPATVAKVEKAQATFDESASKAGLPANRIAEVDGAFKALVTTSPAGLTEFGPNFTKCVSKFNSPEGLEVIAEGVIATVGAKNQEDGAQRVVYAWKNGAFAKVSADESVERQCKGAMYGQCEIFRAPKGYCDSVRDLAVSSNN